MDKHLTVNEALIEAKQEIKNGNLENALQIYSSILQHHPTNKEAFIGLSELSENILNTSKNRVIEPSDNEINELINLFQLGKLNQLEQTCTKLLVVYPQSVQVLNMLGIVFLKKRNYDDAMIYFNKAIELNSNFSDPYNNKGIIYKEAENYEEALNNYNKAIEINPHHLDALNNKANILKNLGYYEEALNGYKEVIKINQNYSKAYYNIADLLQKVTFNTYDSEMVAVLIELFSKKSLIRPKNIDKQVITLLMCDPKFKKILQDNFKNSLKNIDKIIKQISSMPLLLKIMSICAISDLRVESLFTNIRSKILLSISNVKETSKIIRVQEALALQCFTNEYIYNETKEEKEALVALEKKIESTLMQNKKPKLVEILCFASYKALNKYSWSNNLIFPKELDEVVNRLIIEPREEERLKSELKMLELVSNEVSSKVQEQYEQNPYPRWICTRLKLEPVSISKIINMNQLKIYDNSIQQVLDPEILVAGCGTGQQSIDIATTYKNSKVTAIDISLSSLAYAKRKTHELGIKNIEYMQADILDLEKLGKKFDLIDCGGVLHHMEDPIAGWKVLTECLKLNGLMRIGLYSKIARKNINKVRQEIIENQIMSDVVSIKSFRKTLMKSSESHHKKVCSSKDFYTLSEFRDLLFHVQEHQFTLSQIANLLKELKLQFCGFQQDKSIKEMFKKEYTEEDSLYDLNKWDSFEKDNPLIFGGMYQLWCQKIE